MIVGRDMLQELGIIIHFGALAIAWDHDSIEHNDIEAFDSKSPAIVDTTDRMKQILEAKYEAANIKNVVVGCKHLSTTVQKQLFAVLTRFESLFDGTLEHHTKR
jgi:chemotaxis regulatin CheY-phosphate phosphatase CheZ